MGSAIFIRKTRPFTAGRMSIFPLPWAGLFHSQGNQGFVGVVSPCLPSPSTICRRFRDWGYHGGIAPTKNETALLTWEGRGWGVRSYNLSGRMKQSGNSHQPMISLDDGDARIQLNQQYPSVLLR